MTLVPLTDKDRQLGDSLLWPVCSADGTVLIKSGYVIGASEEIDSLLQSEVFFDKTPIKRPPPKYAQEKVAPILLFPDLVQRCGRILQRILLDKVDANFEEDVRTLAGSILQAKPADLDEWIGAIHLNFAGDYTHYHPVKTAVLCLLLGRLLKVDTANLETIVCAALTMNIGMLRLQQTLYHQQTPLTAEQQTEIRGHPARSVELLQSFGVNDGS
ncbi:MAG: HD domain-containing phosphohydrolase, partial [Burkholderiaceae bacterium]